MKRFLGSFFRSLFALLLALIVLAALFVAVLAAIAGSRVVPGEGVLTIDLSDPLTLQGGSPELPDVLLGDVRHPVPLHRARRALESAADDAAIEAVLIHGGVNVELAKLHELRQALAAFAAKGKRVVTWLPGYDEAALYLASAGGEVWLAPLGEVALDGFAAEVLYMHEALQKAGLEVQVTRVGRYKSAVEPLLQDEMSKENEEQLRALLDERWSLVQDGIAAGRKVPRERLESIAQGAGVLTAQAALEAGLIDRVMSRDQVLADLMERHGATEKDGVETFEQVPLPGYALRARLEARQTGGKAVAVVLAAGDIVDGEDEAQAAGDTVASRLRAARMDDDVAAVVLQVDSPGGSATASEVILCEVRALRAAGKPVVVAMSDLAASGGYWIACLADEIVASPFTITGSIGVFGLFPNAAELLERMGVHPQVVRTAPHADADSLLRRKDESELARFQTQVDAIYEAFLDRVAEGRELPRERVRELAEGRVWSARAALAAGLIDAIGGLDDAIARAGERAGLGKKPRVTWPDVEPSPAETLLLALLEDEAAPLARSIAELPLPSRALLGVLRELGNARPGMFARLPYVLELRG